MSEGLVTVAVFVVVHEAEMARGFLESNGIDVFLADGAMSRIASHLTPMIGGIKLQVRQEDADRACELLSEVNSGTF
jgi:hypothetical protein